MVKQSTYVALSLKLLPDIKPYVENEKAIACGTQYFYKKP